MHVSITCSLIIQYEFRSNGKCWFGCTTRVCVCVFHQHRSDGREFQMFVSRLPSTGVMTFQGFKPTTSVLQRGASVPEDELESSAEVCLCTQAETEEAELRPVQTSGSTQSEEISQFCRLGQMNPVSVTTVTASLAINPNPKSR